MKIKIFHTNLRCVFVSPSFFFSSLCCVCELFLHKRYCALFNKFDARNKQKMKYTYHCTEFISEKSYVFFCFHSILAFLFARYAFEWENRDNTMPHSTGWSVCASQENELTQKHNISDQRLNHLPKLCFVEIWFRIENESHSSIQFKFNLFSLSGCWYFVDKCAAVRLNCIDDDFYYRIIWKSKECFKCCV